MPDERQLDRKSDNTKWTAEEMPGKDQSYLNKIRDMRCLDRTSGTWTGQDMPLRDKRCHVTDHVRLGQEMIGQDEKQKYLNRIKEQEMLR